MQYFKDFIVGDLAEAFSGYAFSAKDLVDKGIPVLKIGNIQRKNVTKTVDTYYNGEIVGKLEKYILQQNDFLIAMTGAGSVGRVGKMHDNNTTYLVNQRVAIVRPTKADANFLYYWFSMPFVEKYLYSLGIGAGQPNISAKDILKLKIKIPNRNIQTKIADILSTYDNLIEINNKRIKLLEKIAENLYKEWFIRFRFPEYENAEFENGIPKGWKKNKIESYYTTCSGGTPSRSKPQYYENGIYPWIKTGEIKDCIIIDAEEYITQEALDNSSAKIIPANSVIMAMYGVNIGSLAYVADKMTCNQACCVFSDKRIFSSKHYLYNYLKSIREYLLSISFGAAQQNLSQDLIKNITIVMPTDSIVKAFEAYVDSVYNNIKILLQKNRNLIKQRDLLIPRLMSGKLEVE